MRLGQYLTELGETGLSKSVQGNWTELLSLVVKD
jgi:hypothetical protein